MSIKKAEIVKEFKAHYLAEGEDLRPDLFPSLCTLSPAFIFKFLPSLSKYVTQEYVYMAIGFF